MLDDCAVAISGNSFNVRLFTDAVAAGNCATIVRLNGGQMMVEELTGEESEAVWTAWRACRCRRRHLCCDCTAEWGKIMVEESTGEEAKVVSIT